MGYKKQRLVTKMLRSATNGNRYRDTHVFIGGTGAVGGTALLQMLSTYEEMMSIQPPQADDIPILAATGKGPEDIQVFTRRLFRFVESRHGVSKRPRRFASGYVTHSGIFIALERFQLTALPGLDDIQKIPVSERREFVRTYLSNTGATGSPFDALLQEVFGTRPISTFLKAYRAKLPEDRQSLRFRSVVIGIPLPSLVAYHLDHLREAARHIAELTEDKIEELKKAFRKAFREDLKEIQESLADNVLVAHTTAVGGMYDETMQDGRVARSLRLGFAHSAQDTRLIVKMREAEEFTREYAEIGIKMLITAAAIGIDEVRIRTEIPLHSHIAKKLYDAPVELFPGAKRTMPAEAKASRAAGRAVPSRHMVRVYKPLTIPLDAPPSGVARFEEGVILRPAYSIRSGENGFFSVSNADALYRVMRVVSASELAQVLATVALFGDDDLSPWFPDNVCYYSESDNSRQVFDLLNQPSVFQTQLSGLEPLAFQDLGSAKHQGELHTLSLLILLHRLRTLNFDAIDPYVDLEHFDSARFFVEHSRPLTFEDLANWHIDTITHEMQILASVQEPQDLTAINRSRHGGLFPLKDKAVNLVLERVLKAVWMIPSLGSPLLFEREGKTYVRTGYFVAPFEQVVTDLGAVDKHLKNMYDEHLRDMYEKKESLCTFEEYRNYHLCTGGFVDLRPVALLCTAKNTDTSLRGKITFTTNEQSLRAELLKLEPYSFFTTCGLVALLFRLRGLYSQLREAMAELGTLHEYRWQMPRDINGHTLLVPGVVEAFRMVSEGLEKTTGTERLDGIWGYERRSVPERWNFIPGVEAKTNNTN